MWRALRRLRGWLLRLAFRRRAASVAGVAFAAVAGALLAGEYAWESWITDGLTLVLLATGVALVATGLAGRRPDWIDPDAGPR